MTKKDKALLAHLDNLWNCAKARNEALSERASHPQVAPMIERNKGYMLGIEDVVEAIYKSMRRGT